MSSVGFSARQSFESVSFSSFSPGLNQVAKDFDSGKLGADLLKSALSGAGVKIEGFGSTSFAGSSTVGGSGSSSLTASGASLLAASGASSLSVSASSLLSASGSASLSIPVAKQVEVSRMVMVPKETKVQVPVTKQVPDLANAGKLEAAGNSVTTPGGYKVRMEGDTAFITAPNGKEIKVWGDPHIESSNGSGGKQNIDFRKGTTSFMLPDGSRITMNAYGADGKLAANGLLGKVDVYNGNKHVTLSNGREGTGKTGGVGSSGVKADGYNAAAAQNAGDVLHVVGDGAQLAYKGKLTNHESVSGTTRSGEWATGAAVGQASVGAMSVPIPMKTITEFQEVSKTTFEPKMIKEMKTVMEEKTFSSTFGTSAGSSTSVSANAGMSVGASASTGVSAKAGFGSEASAHISGGAHASIHGNAFAEFGGFGGFKAKSFGDYTMSSVAGAFGGAGLYGNFVNSGASYNQTISSKHSSEAKWGSQSAHHFPGNDVAKYISSSVHNSLNVFNSYNSAVTNFNAASRQSRMSWMF